VHRGRRLRSRPRLPVDALRRSRIPDLDQHRQHDRRHQHHPTPRAPPTPRGAAPPMRPAARAPRATWAAGTAITPSCQGAAADACGGDDCCATDAVPGGWFAMGRGEHDACPAAPAEGDACDQTAATCFEAGVTWGCPTGKWLALGGDDDEGDGADEVPEHTARASFYGLDRYEVTVGRMRRFVEDYDKASLLALLKGGAGSHPKIAAADWQDAWDDKLPADAAALAMALNCNAIHTWTDQPGDAETAPINCVSWYLGYAFCAWDEGRLPAAAEWSGPRSAATRIGCIPGAWTRRRPRSPTTPRPTNRRRSTCSPSRTAPAAGGTSSLAGSVWEWVLDVHEPGWYAGPRERLPGLREPRRRRREGAARRRLPVQRGQPAGHRALPGQPRRLLARRRPPLRPRLRPGADALDVGRTRSVGSAARRLERCAVSPHDHDR
jgi:sulfatase modifying factor 1